MQCAEGAPGLGTACLGTARREQARLSVHVRTVCFTPLTADCHATGPQFRNTFANLPQVPCQKEAVKGRGMGSACCSRAVCSPQPKAPESPELVAVILDDDL